MVTRAGVPSGSPAGAAPTPLVVAFGGASMMKNALFCSQKASASDSTAACWALTGEMPGSTMRLKIFTSTSSGAARLEHAAVVGRY